MPRNVDPAVRALPGVRLIDLADLRSAGLAGAGGLAHDLAAAEEIIEDELQRCLRWLAGRQAAAAVRRMRSGAEEAARQELDRARGRAAGRGPSRRGAAAAADRAPLVHQPTLELRAAARPATATWSACWPACSTRPRRRLAAWRGRAASKVAGLPAVSRTQQAGSAVRRSTCSDRTWEPRSRPATKASFIPQTSSRCDADSSEKMQLRSVHSPESCTRGS